MLKQKLAGLAVFFALGLAAAACASLSEAPPSSSGSPEPSGQSQSEQTGESFYNTLEAPKGPFMAFRLPELTARVKEKRGLNSDSIGWLQVPGTSIDDIVLWYPGDANEFYYRRNFEKRESFNGSYFADFRCTFDGKAKGLAPNTVIYGHSMSDDPNDPRKLFSPLKFFKDEEFAKNTPYIYFSTTEEDLVWEVFAVFNTDDSFPYNLPQHPDFMGLVEQCRKLSLYNYEVSITKEDKLLTLSTCIYHMPSDGALLGYPNKYRYAVMAKLVTDKTALKNEAVLVKNPAPTPI
jgi:sortase B